ncbi:MAG: VOC family protein [Alphaproteobacteria bacterium]|nr:VOC family protein [Alphaproteobacteria bacterium]
MKLGAFSISLAVKDLAASRAFYEKLGFVALGDSHSEQYCMLKNGDAVIGLFQGLFEGNIITFNPGWTQNATPADPFDDVRDIAAALQKHGIAFATSIDTDKPEGPNHFVIADPDGNVILVDQHR